MKTLISLFFIFLIILSTTKNSYSTEFHSPVPVETFETPGDSEKIFVYINGGSDPISNFSINEEDLKSFYYNLFNSEAVVLNAGGPGTKVVKVNSNGQHMRDKDGFIQFQPGLKLEKPFYAAIKENVVNLFDQISKEMYEEVTIVIGDHGNSGYVALWENIALTVTEINDFYRKFSEQTLIRSIYLPCYAGSIIVSPKRRIPRQLRQLGRYVRYYYPMNRCALATGKEDEVGEYYSWSQTWEKSGWTRLFKKYPKINLQIMKEHLAKDAALVVTPVLTSDYLLLDIKENFCKEMDVYNKSISKFGEDFNSWPPMEQLRLEQLVLSKPGNESFLKQVTAICSDTTMKELFEARKKYKKLLKLSNKLIELEQKWSAELIEKEFPEVFAKFKKYKDRANDLYETMTKDKTEDELTLEEKLKLRQLQESHPVEYDVYIESLNRNSKFNSFFNKKARVFIEENKEEYKEFIKEYFMKEKYSGRIIEILRSQVKNMMSVTQRKRKKLEWQYQEKMIKDIVPFLDKPFYKFVKETYKNVKACEASSIN